MVDVSHKQPTVRSATAEASIFVGAEVLHLIKANQVQKGDVLTVAHIAGILAAKQTSNLIPLCHPLPISKVDVSCTLDEATYSVLIKATVKTTHTTGVEMEALMAASVSALTIYDMCKAVSKAMVISNIRLLSKYGGKSGDYQVA
jgi:molybdenum cofactor biosynthesis protein MoaC